MSTGLKERVTATSAVKEAESIVEAAATDSKETVSGTVTAPSRAWDAQAEFD